MSVWVGIVLCNLFVGVVEFSNVYSCEFANIFKEFWQLFQQQLMVILVPFNLPLEGLQETFLLLLDVIKFLSKLHSTVRVSAFLLSTVWNSLT